MRLAVSELCAFPEDTDKLGHVFDMLSSIWLKQERDSRILISDVVASAREINPSYMRVPGHWSVSLDVGCAGCIRKNHRFSVWNFKRIFCMELQTN